MRRGLLAVALSLAVVLGQTAHRSALTDVGAGTAAEGVRLAYPLLHVVLSPVTLVADWLNGGGTRDLTNFLAWTALVTAVALLAAAPERAGWRWYLGRGAAVAAALAALLLFVAYGPRPIPRLVASEPDDLVFDVHSHTSLSHDGRAGFGSHQNAYWHARAGFDAAFVTDHNRCCADKAWRLDRSGRPPRLLSGEELSLRGLHVLALGVTEEISNRGYNDTWDSTLAMVRYLAADGWFVVASLPEYWRHHWGEDLGRLVEAGVEGFEVWTTSPRAMDFPPRLRRELLAQLRRLGLTPLGATDMHGIGRTASVWNVMPLPGWRRMDDAALEQALLAQLRRAGAASNRVIALARWIPESSLGAAFLFPVNAGLILRTASRAHALALLGWIWIVQLAALRLRRAPGSPVSGADYR